MLNRCEVLCFQKYWPIANNYRISYKAKIVFIPLFLPCARVRALSLFLSLKHIHTNIHVLVAFLSYLFFFFWSPLSSKGNQNTRTHGRLTKEQQINFKIVIICFHSSHQLHGSLFEQSCIYKSPHPCCHHPTLAPLLQPQQHCIPGRLHLSHSSLQP